MQEFFTEKVGKGFDEPNLQANLAVPLRIEKLLARQMSELSGGELQKVAIVTTFAQEADLYALDEPSAFVDVEDRFVIAKAISRLVKAVGKSAMVIDHDIQLLDLVSDKMLVFTGKPGVEGEATAPMGKEEGMNIFLKRSGSPTAGTSTAGGRGSTSPTARSTGSRRRRDSTTTSQSSRAARAVRKNSEVARRWSSSSGDSLGGVLPPGQARALETGIDIIGDIAIVKLGEEAKEPGPVVGEAILASMKNVKAVFDQEGGLEGDFRLRRLRLIAGENRTLTLHRENWTQVHGRRREVLLLAQALHREG